MIDVHGGGTMGVSDPLMSPPCSVTPPYVQITLNVIVAHVLRTNLDDRYIPAHSKSPNYLCNMNPEAPFQIPIVDSNHLCRIPQFDPAYCEINIIIILQPISEVNTIFSISTLRKIELTGTFRYISGSRCITNTVTIVCCCA